MSRKHPVKYKGVRRFFDPDNQLSGIKGFQLDYEWIHFYGFENGSLRFNGDLYQVILSPGKTQTFQLYKNGRAMATIRYMHELQNAFYDLTGFEIMVNF